MRGLSTLIRLAIGIGLIFFLLSKTNLKELLSILRSTEPVFLSLAFLSFLTAMILSTLRWRVLLIFEGRKPSFSSMLRAYLVSLFVGNILPSGGLDIVRGYYLSKARGAKSTSFASVAVDRVLGFVAIFLYVVVGFLLGYPELKEFRFIFIIALVSFAVAVFLIFQEPVHRFLKKLLSPHSVGEKLMRFYEAILSYRRNPHQLLYALFISFGIQFFFVLAAYLDGIALGFSLPFLKCLIFISFINFLSMLPITVSGIGVREGGFVVFMSDIMGRAGALSLSLLYFFTGVLVSFIGGFILLIGKEKIEIREPQEIP